MGPAQLSFQVYRYGRCLRYPTIFSRQFKHKDLVYILKRDRNQEQRRTTVSLIDVAVTDSQMFLTFVVLGSKPYDSLTVGEFLAHIFHIGDSLFILLGVR